MHKNLVKKRNYQDRFQIARAAGFRIADLAVENGVDRSFVYKVLKGTKKSERISNAIDRAIRAGERRLGALLSRRRAA